jgi:hypothetical protein
MRRTLTGLAFTFALAAAAASFAGLTGGTRSAAGGAEAMFLVPATDGYGVGECLSSGAACGKVVADAWCQTQGYAQAVSFRRAEADDLTGSVQRVSTAERVETPVAITCAK